MIALERLLLQPLQRGGCIVRRIALVVELAAQLALRMLAARQQAQRLGIGLLRFVAAGRWIGRFGRCALIGVAVVATGIAVAAARTTTGVVASGASVARGAAAFDPVTAAASLAPGTARETAACTAPALRIDVRAACSGPAGVAVVVTVVTSVDVAVVAGDRHVGFVIVARIPIAVAAVPARRIRASPASGATVVIADSAAVSAAATQAAAAAPRRHGRDPADAAGRRPRNRAQPICSARPCSRGGRSS
ncbi:hypothetical protein [Tahibacter caeni]|uniref:hypothetical protein n=1 Tax=Tahibacter caeni TaxID=1453545 RepID=UPI0021485FFD|nr:hypothetical protein [Tahibacter caeni]